MGIANYIKKILTSRYGEDVRQSIADALEECYKNGAESGNANMEVIAARGIYNTLKNRLDAESSRVNNLAKLTEGSTTGDAELVDIRTSEDGSVYENAGDAVRGQVQKAMQKTAYYYGESTVVQLMVDYGQTSSETKVDLKTYAKGKLKIEITYKDSGWDDSNYIGLQVRDDTRTEIKTSKNDEFIIDGFNSRYITLGLFFKVASGTPRIASVKITPLVKSLADEEIEEKINNLKSSMLNNIEYFSGNTFSKTFTVGSGTRVNSERNFDIQTFKKGKLKIALKNKTNWPDDNNFLGLQIRDENNIEIKSSKLDEFTINGFDSSFITCGIFFQNNVEEDVSVTIEITPIIATAYDEKQDEEIEAIKSTVGSLGIGTHTIRYENFGNFEIYGVNKIGTVLKDESGDYYTPPIEISGGKISNLTVVEAGGETEHSAYCLHSESDTNKDNFLEIADTIFKSNSGACIGMGTRDGYKVVFRNCVFIKENDGNCVYIHNSAVGDEQTDPNNPSKISFINCLFIGISENLLKLQDWNGRCNYAEFEFINNTFTTIAENKAKLALNEYRNYSTEELESKEFKNKFSLTQTSCGNNVDWLNA